MSCAGRPYVVFLCFLTSPKTQLKEMDMEELSSQISKFDQYVEQLETGLPPNSSVVVLKNKVETMKQKVGRIKFKLDS